MNIHTFTVWRIEEDGSFTVLTDAFYPYDGPVALLKKGREEAKRLAQKQAKLADEAIRIAAEREAIEKEERGKAEPLVRAWEAPGYGELSPAAAGERAAEEEDLNRVYRGLVESGLRALGRRGFGRAPSGFTSSFRSTLGRSRQEASTAAYRRALAETERGREKAVAYRTGQQIHYEPIRPGLAAGQQLSGAGEALERQRRMGGWFNDLMAGLGAGAQIAGAFVPGGGFASLFKRKGGGGGYAGGSVFSGGPSGYEGG